MLYDLNAFKFVKVYFIAQNTVHFGECELEANV